MRYVLGVLLVLAAATPLAAQETTVLTGQVTRAADGEPVPDASVTIPSLGLSVVTDAEGRYRLAIPDGIARGQRVELHVTSSGLQPDVAFVTLVPGSLTHDFTLSLGFA